jgi:hypothetical protein
MDDIYDIINSPEIRLDLENEILKKKICKIKKINRWLIIGLFVLGTASGIIVFQNWKLRHKWN